MRSVYSLLVLLLMAALSGCGSGSPGSIGREVNLVVQQNQNLAPAEYSISVESNRTLSRYSWYVQEYDAGARDFVRRYVSNASELNYTFANVGISRVELEYTTSAAKSGIAHLDVNVGGGVVTGTISAALNTLVDVDTRDPAEPDNHNNDFENAQQISASSSLAGLVDRNDNVDVYRVQLKAGQKIQLQVADEQTVDSSTYFDQVTMELFRASSTASAVIESLSSRATGRSELVVPEDNVYLIRISALSPSFTSHGIYSLKIEESVSDAEFALGEVLVLFKEGRQYQAQGLRTKQNIGRIKTVSITDATQFLADQGMKVAQTLMTDERWKTLQIVNLLNEQDDIEIAEPNWKRYPLAVTDPMFDQQWHYQDIKLESAWQALGSMGASTVTVAVLDSGIISHPDLDDNRRNGYDTVQDDFDPTDPGDKAFGGQRSSFHGTHVAGTVAAINNDIGGTGVAPGVKLMPVRVLDTDGGFVSDIIEGICYAAQITDSECRNIPTISEEQGGHADIINMSLGSGEDSELERRINNKAMDKGVIVIAAAGNESTSSPAYPAAYDRVISVSATNINGELANYSNYGDTIDVAAPGGDFLADEGILSTQGNDRFSPTTATYGYLQGTSMASPHVAGVAALMKSANPNLTHDEFRTMLVAGELTQDIGSFGKDNSFGYGLIDAEKAVLEVLNSSGPRIISSVGKLRFSPGQTSKSFKVTGNGLDNLQVDEQIDWLSLSSGPSTGDYVATVSTSGLVEGSYQGEIVISTTTENVSDVTILVELQVGNPDLPANAGVQYVLLQDVNAEADRDGVVPTAVGSAAVVASQGVYRYQVNGVPKGRYYVFTGSDLDLDDVICDAGESCGQYPTLNSRIAIEITEQQTSAEANMVVNYIDSGVSSSSVSESVRPILSKDYGKNFSLDDSAKQVAQ